MSTIRVAIAGATGYAGEELLHLLLRHPQVELTCLAASAKWERPRPASEVFPRLGRPLDLPVESLDLARLTAVSDVVFLALPHGAAMRVVPGLLKAGKRALDLSGDFRLKDPALYPRWYQLEHTAPQLLNGRQVAYGLSEFHKESIRAAQLVANPGCYATSILLGCLPLFQAKVVADGRVIVDAKSGLSGAGRKADESLLFTEMSENLRAYKVNTHQHMPEVLQELEGLAGTRPTLTFVPQVIPATRGLISTIYVQTRVAVERISEAYQRCYRPGEAPFVRVRPGTLPELRDVVGTNYCDIGFSYDPSLECLIVASALDNLLKGAAGQAVQNFNLMHGFPETTGLVP